jgi:hypothetical protein
VTHDKRKAATRQRMAETGENYTTARRAVLEENAQRQAAREGAAQNHSDAVDALAEGFSEDKPEQPDNVVTGGEALEEQQQNPDLKDNSGTRP